MLNEQFQTLQLFIWVAPNVPPHLAYHFCQIFQLQVVFSDQFSDCQYRNKLLGCCCMHCSYQNNLSNLVVCSNVCLLAESSSKRSEGSCSNLSFKSPRLFLCCTISCSLLVLCFLAKYCISFQASPSGHSSQQLYFIKSLCQVGHCILVCLHSGSLQFPAASFL